MIKETIAYLQGFTDAMFILKHINIVFAVLIGFIIIQLFVIERLSRKNEITTRDS